MSARTSTDSFLTGNGAAYIRVSDTQQDTARQYKDIETFLERHGLTIPSQHWFCDEGYARDVANRRPEFQRLLRHAEEGKVQWVIVAALDRFGAKSAKQLFHFIYRLEEAGCRLFDVTGKEWTGEDDATEISLWVGGKTSHREQRVKADRILSGKAELARAGEWQGGQVRIGFDVGCFSRDSGRELWRVVFQGKGKRLKVYPDGRTERFDDILGTDSRGKQKWLSNMPRHQKATERLQIVPSNDPSVIKIVEAVFTRYATEAISLGELAHYLNDINLPCAGDRIFQSQHVEQLLRDESYIGYPCWNRFHRGKFKKYQDGSIADDDNGDQQSTPNDPKDWIRSRHRLFSPIIDAVTWDAVQRKLDNRHIRASPSRTAMAYLSGLLYCGNCGAKMVAGPRTSENGSLQYYCGTYHQFTRLRKTAESPCFRNAVSHDLIEEHIDIYLREVGCKLSLLTDGFEAEISFLENDLNDSHQQFFTNFSKLISHIRDNHPEEYARLIQQTNKPAEEQIQSVIECYRDCFNPESIGEQINKLDREHTALMERYADLPTPRAKEKAKRELEAIEATMAELEQSQMHLGDIVAKQFRSWMSLHNAVMNAIKALGSKCGERASRQKAEAVRSVIHRIECHFTATGARKRKRYRLASILMLPISEAADALTLQVTYATTSDGSSEWVKLLLRGSYYPEADAG